MSRKKKQKFQETTIENYYDLKVDKVDELVEALQSSPDADVDEDNQPKEPVPTSIAECTGASTPDTKTRRGKEKHFDPYKIDKFSRIPVWIKAIFIKFWFAGAVCYFVVFGLSLYFAADDLFLLGGVILGVLVDFMVNPIFRMLESDDKEYNKYMMFPFPVKVYWTFLTNIIYYAVVMYIVSYMYTGLNMLINVIAGRPDYYIAVGVEPLLYGVFCVIADMLFIGIKDGIVYGVKKAKAKKLAAQETAEQQPAEEEVTPAQPAEEELPLTEDGQVDEVERLRRIAESRNSDSDDGQKKKNKKK